MQKTINGVMLKSMILTAAKLLEINRASIDALNVFPVPDGDTGTNMSLTIQSAVKELVNCKSNNISEIADAVSKGALRGARGNSGVILSQILKGICNIIGTCEKEVTTKVFAKALAEGAAIAYKAVAAPKEGTILTVIRVIAESAQRNCKKHTNFEPFFEAILNDGEASGLEDLLAAFHIAERSKPLRDLRRLDAHSKAHSNRRHGIGNIVGAFQRQF
jgi:dihydroxyacetone kinase-like predicted kinase